MLKAYAGWVSGPCGARLHDAGLLVLRLWFGLSMLVLHGLGKWQNFEKASEGFPDPLGLGPATSLGLAVFGEVVCAVLLAVGLATRFAALALVVTMAVAWGAVHGMALTGENSGEMAFLYLGGFLALLLAGPGRFSLDHLILRSLRGAA